MSEALKATRRSMLGLMAGGAAGLAGGSASAARATQDISAETLDGAEPLFAVTHTD